MIVAAVPSHILVTDRDQLSLAGSWRTYGGPFLQLRKLQIQDYHYWPIVAPPNSATHLLNSAYQVWTGDDAFKTSSDYIRNRQNEMMLCIISSDLPIFMWASKPHVALPAVTTYATHALLKWVSLDFRDSRIKIRDSLANEIMTNPQNSY